MLNGTTLRSDHGRSRITRTHAQLLTIDADTDSAAYHAQGYATADQRLWQLELSRRLASGRLAEILGAHAVSTDRFQRKLNLQGLAQRSLERHAHDPERPFLKAYVEGINLRLASTRILPPECLALGHRPDPFGLIDVYLIAHLKYFINSAWQFELHHTVVSNALEAQKAADLFCTIDESGARASALPGDLRIHFASELQELLDSARQALEHLGLDSPDIGSNAFAISGSRTQSGLPLLANDPHMGLVNPGFNMFFHLRSDQGLNVCGSNFPGGPGIVVGRNPDIAWGLTGAMMDNQDLYWGEVDLVNHRVRTHRGWEPLPHHRACIHVKGEAPREIDVHGGSHGQLLHARQGIGLFLKWPALDGDLGSISLHTLNCATDWSGFRQGMTELRNCPGVAVYADRANHIGAQIYGLMPRRKKGREMAGALVLPLHEPEWQWQGYVPTDALPHTFDPPEGVIVHANQHAADFLGDTYISNRWHPPARARRIRELLSIKPVLTPSDLMAIQDDQVDLFARTWLPRLLARLPDSAAPPPILAGWSGDTRNTQAALLFEQWMEDLAQRVLCLHLSERLAIDYVHQWPSWRWNLMLALFGATAWMDEADVCALIQQSLAQALTHVRKPPRVVFRHTLRRNPILRTLFEASLPYTGGSRETVSALRRNVDFLTKGQGGGVDTAHPAFSFGTSFKLVYDLKPGARNFMLANMPNSGNPFFWALKRHLRRWQRGRRHVFRL